MIPVDPRRRLSYLRDGYGRKRPATADFKEGDEVWWPVTWLVMLLNYPTVLGIKEILFYDLGGIVSRWTDIKVNSKPEVEKGDSIDNVLPYFSLSRTNENTDKEFINNGMDIKEIEVEGEDANHQDFHDSIKK